MEPGKLGKAFELAFAAHKGQTDKLGEVYMTHLVRVASAVDGPLEQIVALLHDVIEDCGVSYDQIAKDFGTEIADAVESMTKREDEAYEAYLTRVSQNPIAKAVKRADLADNSNPSRMARLPAEIQERLMAKYALAASVLNKEGH